MRSVKHGKKKSKRINFNKNSAKNKRKAVKRRKEMVGMPCKPLKDNWDKRKTVKQNLLSMGLAYDPNKLFPPPSAISSLAPNSSNEMMEVDEAKTLGSVAVQRKKTGKAKKQKKGVVQIIEEEANKKRKPSCRVHNFNSNQTESQFYIFLLEKYDDDYEAMSRDPKNIYQHTPKQLEKKLKTFRQSSYYLKYIVDRDEPEEMSS